MRRLHVGQDGRVDGNGDGAAGEAGDTSVQSAKSRLSKVKRNIRQTTRDAQLDLVGAKLNKSNTQVLRPPKPNLCQEDKRNRHPEPIRRDQRQQRTKHHHDAHRARQRPPPAPDPRPKQRQQHRSKGQAQVLRQRQRNGVLEIRRLIRKKDGNHGRVHHVEAVVKHGDHEPGHKRRRELAAAVAREDARGREGLFEGRECLPEGKGDHGCEAGDERADDSLVRRVEGRGVDDAREDERRSEDEEHCADVVELAEGLLGGQAAGVGGREVVEVEADEGEDDEDGWAVEEPSPLAGQSWA